MALDRRGRSHGIQAFSLHPGQILTNLARHLSPEEIASFDALDREGRPIVDPERGMRTVEQGAATSVWCATNPRLDGQGGVYCEDCDIAAPTDPDAEDARFRGVDAHAYDRDAAARLWEVSAALTGVDAFATAA